MATPSPFSANSATVNIAATTSTGNVALGGSGYGHGGISVRIYNAGPATVFIEFGTSAVTAATATSIPVPAGAIETQVVGPAITHVAAITASGTATVYFTPGQGL